jgi:RNA polymerase sigma-70 factor (ECF subfamily)
LSLDDDDWGVHQMPGKLPDPLENLERRERMEILQQAVQKLSEADRRFVHYYYGLNLSPEAVARRMGISVNTVYSRKNKVRTKLMKLVNRHLRRVKKVTDE